MEGEIPGRNSAEMESKFEMTLALVKWNSEMTIPDEVR